MKKRIVIPMLFLLVFPVLCHAAAITAQVDRNQLTIDDTLTLTVSVKDTDAEVDTSAIKDFRILSRSSGSNYQWINGKSSSEYTHSYVLSPVRKGNLVIPRLSVKDKGKQLFTEQIEITVDDGQSNRSRAVDKENSELYVKAHVNDTSPYVGQQILYTFYLYTAVQINGPSLKTPDFKGFTVKQTEKDNNYTSIINGREYNIVERHIWLQPLKPGTIEIPPSLLECNVVARERTRTTRDPFGGMFDDPFFGGRSRLVKKVLRTQPVAIAVRPLPKNPYDTPFSGLIGKISMNVKVDNRDMKVGDSSTLTCEIEGAGNLMDAAEPSYQVPEGLKTYKDNPEENIKLGKQGYSGKKTFRIAVVPVKEGRYTIPPVKLNYFDIEKGIYQVLSSQPIELNVQPGPPGSSSAGSPASPVKPDSRPIFQKNKVEYTGHDILPLKESLSGVSKALEMTVMQFSMVLMSLAIVLIAGRGILSYQGRTRTAAMMMDDRAEGALKAALKKDISDEEFLSNLYKAFVSKIYSKSDAQGETLTSSEIRKILNTAGYDADVIKDAESLLNDIESVRFGGGKLDGQKRSMLLENTRMLLRRLK